MEKQQNIKRMLSLGVVVLLLGCVRVATPAAKREREPLTNEQRKSFLKAHNDFRANPSKGLGGTDQPTAGDMKRIYWNSALEADAVAWTAAQVERKKMGHGNSGVVKLKEFPKMLNVTSILPGNIGQNSMGGLTEPTKTVADWQVEGKNYKFGDKKCTKGMCGHYTQVLWSNSKYVGCGIGSKAAYLNCNYFPPGNWPGKNPYTPGKPCSLCKNYKDGFTECEGGLCQPKDKCSPVKECKVVDTEYCLCSEDEYNDVVTKLVKENGFRLAPSSLLLLFSVVVSLLISSPYIA